MTDRRDDDDDFADAVEDLSTQLASLRDELEREAPRGPLGLPRPPSPGEFLRFADEVAIPGTIAILEANVRLLETVQRAIRFAERGDRARERTADVRSTAVESADRLGEVSDRTLERLEGSLSDLQRALEAGPVPDDEAGRELVAEARALREDVRSRLRDAGRTDYTLDDFEDDADRADAERGTAADTADPTGDETTSLRDVDDGTGHGVDVDGDDGRGGGDGAKRVQVDVDAELETLKDRYGTDEAPEARRADAAGSDEGASGGDDGPGGDGDEGASGGDDGPGGDGDEGASGGDDGPAGDGDDTSSR